LWAIFKIVVAIVISLTGLIGPLWANDQKSDAIALVQRAREQEDLQAQGSPPYQIHSQILIRGNHTQVQGEYRSVWKAKDLWVEKLTIGDFQRVRFGLRGGYRQVRSVDYSPQVAFDFDRATDINAHLRNSPEETLGKTRNRKIDGASLSCVEVRSRKTNALLRELCIDSSTGLLSRVEFSDPMSTVVDYSHFSSASGKTYPMHMQMRREHGFSMEISVFPLEKVSTELPTWPENAEFWEGCEDSVPAELISKVSVQYPQEARAARQQGTVSLYVVIEKDGTVSRTKLLQSVSDMLDQNAKEAVLQWRYRPAMCGVSPVRTETVIDVTFSLLY
jgi:TonB family protein